MKRYLTLLSLLIVISCNPKTGPKTNSRDNNDTTSVKVIPKTPDYQAAIEFINDYVKFRDNPSDDTTWIRRHHLLTENFKNSYYHLIDSVSQEDPDMGLDFDPILDAQDFPDKGFELAKFDSLGFITVKGVDWADFLLVLKVVFRENKWLVDGSGIINIPPDKRAKR